MQSATAVAMDNNAAELPVREMKEDRGRPTCEGEEGRQAGLPVRVKKDDRQAY